MARDMGGNGRRNRFIEAQRRRDEAAEVTNLEPPMYGPFRGYQTTRTYLPNSTEYTERLLAEERDRLSELNPNDMSEANNTATVETNIEKPENASHSWAEIENAIAEVRGSQDAASDIQSMFDNHGLDAQEQSTEVQSQQEAYGISYEMISGRAEADNTDSDLQELDSENSDLNSNDLESILGTDRPDGELMELLNELGHEDADDIEPDEQDIDPFIGF